METKHVIIGLGLLATAGILMSAKKKPIVPEEPTEEPTPAPVPKPSPIVLDKNKTLKKGVKGAEVRELQRLLGITADGDFGPATEKALLKAKGVTSIALSKWSTVKFTPPIRPLIPPIDTIVPFKKGDRLMAKLKTGANLSPAIEKADGTYYPTKEVIKTVDFGQEVGKVLAIYKSQDNAEYLYRVEHPKLIGASILFARHSEVEVIKR